jgi:hypothetical protein
MKTPPSKEDLRAELEAAMGRFLGEGGHIERVPQGVSGREDGAPSKQGTRDLFIEPRAPRTQIPEVLAALDARRRPPRREAPRRTARPRRKLLYDDFGEPLRVVWVDD